MVKSIIALMLAGISLNAYAEGITLHSRTCQFTGSSKHQQCLVNMTGKELRGDIALMAYELFEDGGEQILRYDINYLEKGNNIVFDIPNKFFERNGLSSIGYVLIKDNASIPGCAIKFTRADYARPSLSLNYDAQGALRCV